MRSWSALVRAPVPVPVPVPVPAPVPVPVPVAVVLSVVLAALSGCWTERAPSETTPARPLITTLEPAPPSGPSRAWTGPVRRGPDRCRVVISHVFEQAKQDLSSTHFPEAMLEEMFESMVESCHETQWSEESLACYEATTTSSATSSCYHAMTTAQREDFQHRITAIMQRHQSSLLSPPPPPPSSSP